MLDALDREDRLQLMRFVCSFAWADLEVTAREREFRRALLYRPQLPEKAPDPNLVRSDLRHYLAAPRFGRVQLEG